MSPMLSALAAIAQAAHLCELQGLSAIVRLQSLRSSRGGVHKDDGGQLVDGLGDRQRLCFCATLLCTT